MEFTLFAGEQDRINAAHAALEADDHAPRELSVKILIHKHSEYPKMLYSGKTNVTVANEAEEQVAIDNGYGPYVSPEANSVEGGL